METYYKDGKSKQVWEIYSDEGKETLSTTYATVNTDEKIIISEKEKKVTLEHGNIAKLSNSPDNIRGIGITFTVDNWIAKLGSAFIMSISTDTYDVGKEYYVIKNQFENNNRWEEWVDKETGMPIRTINRGSTKEYYLGTNVIKEVRDNVQEHEYSFETVTDEDVKVPDIYSLGYEIEKVENSLDILE